MFRRTIAAVAAILALAAVVGTASALALSTKTKRDYTSAYYPALKRCGEKPGPQLRKVPGDPSSARFHAWTRKLNGMCRPQPKLKPVRQVQPKVVHYRQRSYTQPQPQSGGGGGGCSGMSAESGSLGYNNNTNPGYVGCYQISKDHFNGGSCSGLGTDPAGQDKCAAIICRTEGAGAWTNSAGQNPCGRLGG